MSDPHGCPVTESESDGGADAAPRSRIERIVAAGRLVIIFGCLLAFSLDPSGSGVLGRVGVSLLAGYLAYVLAIIVHVWLGRVPTHRWRVADQALDVTVGILLLALTGGTSSPFFAYLSFPILFATLRWRWRGALAAGVPTTVAFVMLGAVELYQAAPLEIDSFTMRSVFLGAVTGLLCSIGAYEQRVRRTMRAIALWNPPSGNDDGDIATLLGTAGALVGARRAVLAWTNRGDPALHMAFWTGVDVRCWEETAAGLDDLIAEAYAAIDFLGHDVATPAAPVIWLANGRLNQQRGIRAVSARLQARFAMRSVIAVRLHGELVRGRLFLLDVPSLTSDDLLMGGLVARRVQGRLEARLTARQLAAAAAAEERMQLARNIHDGALQALTGIRLELEAARRLFPTQPEAAEASLQELHDIVTSEHRTLRRLVSRLQRAESMTSEPDESISELIAALVTRIERQWNVRVRILIPILDAHLANVPPSVMGEAYQVLLEALVNAARHAHATTLTVSLRVDRRSIRMTIADDGEGFPFTGRHDLARLIRYDMGPAVLRDRVAALTGTLVIESTRQGSRLDISIPFAPAPGRVAPASSTER
jgi:signal transduction histidine kinase